MLALARNVGGLEELDDEIQRMGGTATLVPLDLRDTAGLDRLAASIQERWGKLDILLGNAGILGELAPLPHIDPRVWNDLLAINLTANWRLISTLDPLLRRSDAGRAIFVTSTVGHAPRPYWGGYAVSKAALEALALTYAAECAASAVRVNLVNPGPTRTRMRSAAMPGEDAAKLPEPETLGPLFVALASPDCPHHGALIEGRADRD